MHSTYQWAELLETALFPTNNRLCFLRSRTSCSLSGWQQQTFDMNNMVRHGSDVFSHLLMVKKWWFYHSCGVNDRFSRRNMQILFANKVVNAGVIEIPFLWGLITVNIYYGNFEGISLTIVHCFTNNFRLPKRWRNPEPWRWTWCIFPLQNAVYIYSISILQPASVAENSSILRYLKSYTPEI